MKLLFDLHTHTVASGHAFSTLKENIEEAVNYTLKNAKEDDIIISAGSLYMIGTVRTLLNDMIMLSY